MASLALTERPRDPSDIRRLISRRQRQIRVLEKALLVQHPADVRRIMLQRLAGTRANRQSWIDHLQKVSTS